MDDELVVLVTPEGDLRYVYSDALDAAFAEEPRTTTRASHVEPHPTRPGWLADMRPRGGGVLGAAYVGAAFAGEVTSGMMVHSTAECVADWIAQLAPFPTRQAALDAERAWLREHEGL